MLSFHSISWDDYGNYDLPAAIHYILSLKNQSSLIYIGHSLGCGQFWIAMVKHPELIAKIDLMVKLCVSFFLVFFFWFFFWFFFQSFLCELPLKVALAPLSSFQHFTGPLSLFLPFYRPIAVFTLLLISFF